MLPQEEKACNAAEQAAKKRFAEYCVVQHNNGRWRVYPYDFVVNTPSGRMLYGDKRVRAVNRQGKWRHVTIVEFIKARAKAKVLPDERILAHLRHCFSYGNCPDRMTVEAVLRDVCREQAEACFGICKLRSQTTPIGSTKKSSRNG